MDKTSGLASRVALLLFGSGACALVYETIWLREFGLVFGGSTHASAIVLAIFMGGMGFGGLLLGRRADRHPRPLQLYLKLELGVAASAALFPVLHWLVGQAYLGLGGSLALGPIGATAVRLIFAVLVIGLPAFLMGGTLPAAVRAVASHRDADRRVVALLYGSNTLGAVAGVVLSTFILLEVLGNRATLWSAVLVNLIVVVVARSVARAIPVIDEAAAQGLDKPLPLAPAASAPQTLPPAPLVLVAAGVSGFAFLLMELVWFRMLGPLLGGTTFTFGLILAVALAGIGAGGAAYALVGRRTSPTLLALGTTFALEALAFIIPYALGDSTALLVHGLRGLRDLGFAGQVFGWGLVASLVVLPGALVAGYQFPLLIALLGRGRADVGRHLGQAYAWNTAGAILGSLGGGFVLLPALTAPGAWRLVVVVLAGLAVSAVIASLRASRSVSAALPVALALLAIGLVGSKGPTAIWRHGGIGAGRSTLVFDSPNAAERSKRSWKRAIRWEAEGIESSVALWGEDGWAFIVNGKSDGAALRDAGTQVMGGLLAGLRHANPRNAFVVGLGTGSTAGWLAKVPTIEHVDVAELEPAIVHVAQECVHVNEEVLSNPRVRLLQGDARELLQVSPTHYDIIFSEPSNPYRAGIASLFTEDFYRSAAGRLAPGGVFAQWLQTYEVDAQTVRTVYATLGAVFSHVETWEMLEGDLVLLASNEARPTDGVQLGARVQEEPYRRALAVAWRTNTLEGVLSHYVAGPGLASALAALDTELVNTDDCNLLEFGFARSAGNHTRFPVKHLRVAAHGRWDRPLLVGGGLDWDTVAEMGGQAPRTPTPPGSLEIDAQAAARALRAARNRYRTGRLLEAFSAWRAAPAPPTDIPDLAMLSECAAEAGDARAEEWLQRLMPLLPAEATMYEARLRHRQGATEAAWDAALRAIQLLHQDPWSKPDATKRFLGLFFGLAKAEPARIPALRAQLLTPFAANAHDDRRRRALAVLAAAEPGEPHCVEAHGRLEPHYPWAEHLLRVRAQCYAQAGHPRAILANEELERFLEAALAESLPLQPQTRPAAAQAQKASESVPPSSEGDESTPGAAAGAGGPPSPGEPVELPLGGKTPLGGQTPSPAGDLD